MDEVDPASVAARGTEVTMAAISELELVPADVRDLERRAARESSHRACENAEPVFARRFVAALEQHLQAETNSEVRHSRGDGFGDGVAKASRQRSGAVS